MLNKNAEKVLKCIIKKSNKDFDELIDISHNDFKDKKFSNSLINSICNQLKNEGYISRCYPSLDENDYLSVCLNHAGYSYFDIKQKKNFRFWVPIIISNIIAFAALIISIIALLK